MRSIQLYGTAAATASAVAQVTIPSATRIKAVGYSVAADQAADNSHLALELSKVPTSQISVNAAQDPFFALRLFTNLQANGQTAPVINGVQPVYVECRQGEIIYLHCYIVTTTFYANFILWF